MKKIKSFSINKNTLPSSTTRVGYNITGEQGAVFSLQIKDNSSPNKFYNFVTDVFTTTFTSENTLSNVVLSNSHSGFIVIPAAASGDTYKFLLSADPHFNTQMDRGLSVNPFFTHKEITQNKDVTVRFSTSSEQDNTNLVGIGAFVGSTSGSANAVSNTEVAFTETLIDSSTGAHGYKWTAPTSAILGNSLTDNLQPKDKDFYIEVATQTDGAGTDSTTMIIDSVSNLVVGMSLVDIADSSDEEQSGTLGVLTYPTITAIDADTKTLTLSAAPDWGDDKAVKFRAYGSDLITKSCGGIFEFNLTVYPESSHPDATRIKNWGRATVNGAISGVDSIAVDGARGLSAGAKIIGAKVNSTDGANVITEVHSSGTPITVASAQTLADNTLLRIYGSSDQGTIEGTIKIKKFPSASTDVYFDVDRAFTLSTLT
tara:strand:+ start:424 stop:1707 length:1284 start_codon:yes stop_codon:yes gene_type:complete